MALLHVMVEKLGHLETGMDLNPKIYKPPSQPPPPPPRLFDFCPKQYSYLPLSSDAFFSSTLNTS